MSITVIWSRAQPRLIALPRRSYWRIADSVLWMTCLRLDWRTYKKACRDRWAAVTLDAAVSENTRLLLGSGMVVRDGQGTVPARTRPARTLISSAVSAAGSAARSPGRAGPASGGRRAGQAGGQAGGGVAPGGDALAGQHAQA